MRTKNEFMRLFKISNPVIQAPMAGITTPSLVAAVSNSGSLGSLGAAYMKPEELEDALKCIQQLTSKPYQVNLFTPVESKLDHELINKAQKKLERFHQLLNIESIQPDFTALIPFEKQVEVLLKAKVPIFSFTFGIPSKEIIKEFKKAGSLVIGTATTCEEGLAVENSGADAVVAQGMEAGGHRGTFLGGVEEALIGTVVLTRQIAKAVKVPVIAAGGIMDGIGIAAVLRLGASAAQLGTAFVVCPECSASKAWKDALLNPLPQTTVISNTFTGRAARMLKNTFTEEMKNGPIASYPFQGLLTRALRQAAAAQNNREFISLYAGQGFALARQLPAAELVSLLVEEFQTANLLKIDKFQT